MIPETAFSPAFTRPSFLETIGAGEALRRLEVGLGAREPFLLVTGDPGTGKTTLAHEALARWGPRVASARLAYTALTGAELLEEILRRFGAEPPEGASRPRLVAGLERSLAEIAERGQVPIVVVDDAHRLSPELLEELRQLVNAAQQAGRPLEVLLLGLPALESTLEDPALAALRQRVSVRVTLGPLSVGETRRYIRHRIAAAGGDGSALFPRRTCADIAERAHGVPREVGLLAAEALRVARAAGAVAVEPEHVQAATESLRGSAPLPPLPDAEEVGREEARPEPVATRATAQPGARIAAPDPVRTAAPAWERPPAQPPAARPGPRHTDAASPLAAEKPVDVPTPVSAASQDPREWVARFVGDRGPVRIGSMAPAQFASAREPSGPGGAAAPDSLASSLAGAAGPPAPRRSKRGRVPRAAAYALFAGCVVVAAGVFIVRIGRFTSGRSTPAGTVPTSLSETPRGARSGPAATTRGGAGKRASGSAASDSTRAATAEPANPTGRYTLEVAELYDLQAAFVERDRLQALTGLEGWVVPAPEGRAGPHRVVLGIYRSRERASAAARMLLSSQTLAEVSVAPLPRRSARR